MIHTITLIILGCLIIANLVVLINVSNNPMYNAMDKYNAVEGDMNIAHVIAELRGVIDDIDIRLTKLEDNYAYHIQSTDELKPGGTS